MPTPNNINSGINLYSLANIVDAVYYSPDSKDPVEREKYQKYIPDGWVLLEETSDSPNRKEYERYGHKAAVYKVPARLEDKDKTIKEGDEIVVVARGSEFKEKFNALNAYHDARIGAGLYHEGERAARDYFKEVYTKYAQDEASVKPKRIVVTGQSLGGNEALAMLIEAQANGWLEKDNLKVEGIGYFGPGTSAFNIWALDTKEREQLTRNFARINVNNDIVPHAPAQKKIGKEYQIFDSDTEEYAKSAAINAGLRLGTAAVVTLGGNYALQVINASVGEVIPEAKWFTTALTDNLKKFTGANADAALETATKIANYCYQHMEPWAFANPATLASAAVFFGSYGPKEFVDLLSNIKDLKIGPADVFDVALHAFYAATIPKLPSALYPVLPNVSPKNALLTYFGVLPGIKAAGGSLFAGHTTEPIKNHFRNSPVLGNMDPASLPKLGDQERNSHQKQFEKLMEINAGQYELLTPQQRIFIADPNASPAETQKIIAALPQRDGKKLSLSSSQQIERTLTRNNFVDEIVKLTSTLNEGELPDMDDEQTLVTPLMEKIDELQQGEWQEVRALLKYMDEKKKEIKEELGISPFARSTPRPDLTGYALHISKLSTEKLNEELAHVTRLTERVLREKLVAHRMLEQMVAEVKNQINTKLASIEGDNKQELEKALSEENADSIPSIEEALAKEMKKFQDLPYFPVEEFKKVQLELDGGVAKALPMKLSTSTAHNAIANEDVTTDELFKILDAQLNLISFYINSSLITDQPSEITEQSKQLREELTKIVAQETEELKKLKLTYGQATKAYEEGLHIKNSIEGSKTIVLDEAMVHSGETGARIQNELNARNAKLSVFDRFRSKARTTNKQLEDLNTKLGKLTTQQASTPHTDNLRTLQEALADVSEDMSTLKHNMALIESTLAVGRAQLDSESMVRARGWLKLVNDKLQQEQDPAAMTTTVDNFVKDWKEKIASIFKDINSTEETQEFKKFLRQNAEANLQGTEPSIEEKYLSFVEQQLSRMTTDMEKTIQTIDALIEQHANNLTNDTETDVAKVLAGVTELKTILEKELQHTRKKLNQTNLNYSRSSQKGKEVKETHTYLSTVNLSAIPGRERYKAPPHNFDILDRSIESIDRAANSLIVRAKWDDNGPKEGLIEIPINRASTSNKARNRIDLFERKIKAAADSSLESSSKTPIASTTLERDRVSARDEKENQTKIRQLLSGNRKNSETNGLQDISGWRLLMDNDQRYRTHEGKYILYQERENTTHYKEVHKYQIAHIKMVDNQAPVKSFVKPTVPLQQDYVPRPGPAKSFAETTASAVLREGEIKGKLVNDHDDGIDDKTLSIIAKKHARSPSQSENDVNPPLDLTQRKFKLEQGTKLIEKLDEHLLENNLAGRLLLSKEFIKEGNVKTTTYYQVTRKQLKYADKQLYTELLSGKELSRDMSIAAHGAGLSSPTAGSSKQGKKSGFTH